MKVQSKDLKALLKQELLSKIREGISPSSIKNFRSLNCQKAIGRVNELKHVNEQRERTNRNGCVKNDGKKPEIPLVKGKGDELSIYEKRKRKGMIHNKSKRLGYESKNDFTSP